MKQNLILWTAAAVITYLAGYLQSRLNEFYPVSGSFGINGKEIGYKLDKVHYGNDDYKFLIKSELNDLRGSLSWKKTDEDKWESSPLFDSAGVIVGKIPGQKPLAKVKYLINLNYNDRFYTILPGHRPIEMTFFGKIPASVNFYYFFTLFGGLLLAFRTGLEYFHFPGKLKTFEIFTLIFFIVNVFAFSPLRRSYEMGVIGTGGIPLSELFPLSSVLLFIIWAAATALIFNTKNYKIWTPPAAVLTLLVFELGPF